jgi:hypothetical protein
MHDGVIEFAVLSKSHAFKRLLVQPIHIRMGVARVSSSTIDLPPIHLPQVGNDIDIGFGDITSDIRIQYLGV